ncbi:hypothetical protein RRG08_026917 [Elysia crispata]|uniref:Uncharacterized protein n=1 Tax=Elysia crispata TaxID=231223 RepID=A0AAE1DA09_9GAST|nr:hypothetical protein RRG08_026917 [Elysia crispata]
MLIKAICWDAGFVRGLSVICYVTYICQSIIYGELFSIKAVNELGWTGSKTTLTRGLNTGRSKGFDYAFHRRFMHLDILYCYWPHLPRWYNRFETLQVLYCS